MITNRRPRLRYGRADSGLYCREAVEGLEQLDARFVIVRAKRRDWSRNYAKPTESPSPKTDAERHQRGYSGDDAPASREDCKDAAGLALFCIGVYGRSGIGSE